MKTCGQLFPRLLLLASDLELDRWFRVALESGPDVVGPFEFARTRLAYAEWLRLVSRPSDAFPYAAAAHTTFGELGAEPWWLRAERAAV